MSIFYAYFIGDFGFKKDIKTHLGPIERNNVRKALFKEDAKKIA